MARSTKQLVAMFIIILLATLGTAVQANGPAALPDLDRPGPGLPAGAVSPEGLLNADGTLDLSSGFQGTLDLRGWEVVLDGERGPVLKPASRPAAFQVTAWNALPSQGLNDRVSELAVSGSDLYVGGEFTQTGDGTVTSLGYIARYNTAAGTWNALPKQGLNDVVHALAASGSDLYMGGVFTQTGDGTLPNLGRMARYDTTAGTWHALPNQGLDYWVVALLVSGSDLYVGGGFGRTGDGTLINLGGMARYDTTAGTWNALPNQGLDDWVFALAVSGSDLYVGGMFTQTDDGTLTNLGGIARYDTTAGTWHTLPNQGLNGGVVALAVSGSDLYVGGLFTQTGDGSLPNLGYMARYDTTAGTWHALPNQGLNGAVSELAVSGSDLYVGGALPKPAMGR